MPVPAITLEVLPAGYGDCLLVSCPVGRRTWRLLVDTGPDETFPQLKARLAQLPVDTDGKRHIDLAIISHIDHDHIGGASLLVNEPSLNLSFGDVWFNAPRGPAMRGAAEGESLSRLLGSRDVALPWNKAFGGKAVVTPPDGGFVELPDTPDAPRITVLSPTPARLAELFKVWDRELLRLRKKETDPPVPAQPVSRGAAAFDVEALAAKVTATDRSAPNGSSIAILLEHQGASALLCADAFPTVMVPALQALALKRRMPGGLRLDAIKLSHHGSRANVTADLLKVVKADHYVFSTNNAIFRHPDDEAVARVLVHGGRLPTLWFNYATERNRRWVDEALQGRHGYQVRYPEAGKAGVTIALPARLAGQAPH
jgi:beta-lactamase superfamily II metal-dependent hydrolase